MKCPTYFRCLPMFGDILHLVNLVSDPLALLNFEGSLSFSCASVSHLFVSHVFVIVM